jgi:hypothetical protein
MDVDILLLIVGILTLIAAACAVRLAKRGIDEQSRIDKLNTAQEVEVKLSLGADAAQGGRPNLCLSLVNTGRVTICMKSVRLWWPAAPGQGRKGSDFTTDHSAPLNPGEPRIYWLLPAGVKEIMEWDSVPEKLWVDIESFKGLVHRLESPEVRTGAELLRRELKNRGQLS